MRQVSYVDNRGRRWAALLPDDAPDSDARLGLHLGPPDVSRLGLPRQVALRLHNELFARSLFTLKDTRSRRIDVVGALMAALKVDVERIVGLYAQSQNHSDEAARPAVPEPRGG